MSINQNLDLEPIPKRGECRNPFRPDGGFTCVDKFSALEQEAKRCREYLEGMVRARRMKPENFASKVGALESIVEDLRMQMMNRIPPELQETAPLIIYLKNEAHRQKFMTWAQSQGIPTRPA